MAASGFTPEDFEDDFFEVWPDCWPAVLVFLDVRSQWRVSMGGPTALDYGVLFHRMDRLKLSDEDYEDMFQDVKHIESGALAEIHRKKD